MLAASDRDEMESWLSDIRSCIEVDQGATRSVSVLYPGLSISASNW